MTRTLTATALTAVLALAGCTADPEPSTPVVSPATPTTATPTTPPTTPAPTVGEGPADVPAVWPDKLTARLAKLDRIRGGVYTEPGQTLIRVTITITNGGALPVPGDNGRLWIALLYGPDRYKADQDPGNTDTADRLTSRKPGRVAGGSTVTVFESYNVPTNALGELAVTVELPVEEGIREPHTFTGAESLLK